MRIRTVIAGAAIAGLSFTAAPAALAENPIGNSNGNACYGQINSTGASIGLTPGQVKKAKNWKVAGGDSFTQKDAKELLAAVCKFFA